MYTNRAGGDSDGSAGAVPRAAGPRAAMPPPLPRPPLSPSLSLSRREVVSTLPPAERKVSFKPLKISARATIYPGHFPEPSPPAPGSPGWLPAAVRLAQRARQRLCPRRQRPALSPRSQPRLSPPRGGPGAGARLRPCGGWWRPRPGSTRHVPAPCSRDVLWRTGLLALPLAVLVSGGSGTGLAGTLCPGQFPISCYFLIPFAARRAARQPDPLDARQSAAEGQRDGAPPPVPSRGTPPPPHPAVGAAVGAHRVG